MKEVVIKSSTAPAKPRSEKYPIGTTIVKTSSGTTVINTTGGSSIDVIKTDEIKTPTDSNVLSALRSLTEFINKNKDSDVSAVVNYLQGLKIDGKQLSRLVSENEDAGELLDTDVMSALRVISEIGGNNEALKKMFLRKDQEDVAAFLIQFLQGINVKNGVTTDTLSASANVSSPTATISDKTTTLNLLVQAVADMYDLNVSHVATLFRTTIKDYISSELYTPGLTGSGMKLYKALNGDWNLELDNVVVRKAMTVFELIISKIRAVNGGLVISPANGKVKSVLLTNGIYRLEIEGDMMFVADDLVRCQTFTKTGSKYYWVRITSASGAYVFINATEFTTSLPTAGDDLVQFGNKTNALRQGIIYLTASEDGKPRISVLDGVNSTDLTGKAKVILGCLDGVVDSDFPADTQPSGYGLYAQNVFLKGLFVLRNGKSVESEITATNDAVQTAQSVADAAQTAANHAKTEAEKVHTEYKSDFSVLSGKVESKVSQTDFNALGNRVSSAESSITQLPNQIALSVTESKQYTDGKVDAVQVGGRNLVKGSAKTIVSDTSYNMSKTSQQLKGKTITVSFEYEYENVSTGTDQFSQRFGFEWPLQKPNGAYYYLGNWVRLPASSTGLNGSGRAINTFTVPSDHTDMLSTAPINIQVAGGTVRVWNFKIEEGNKATDWSPAPEDVDAEITTAQTAANNAQTEAEKVRTEYTSAFSILSGKVESKVSQTDFNALGSRVSSAESTITQLPNQIALSVTESKQYTDGKVDAVQIGGRNLLKSSNKLTLSNRSTPVLNWSSETDGYLRCVPNSSSTLHLYLNNETNITDKSILDEPCVISFLGNGNGARLLVKEGYVDIPGLTNSASEMKRITVKVAGLRYSTWGYPVIRLNPSGWIYIKDVKIESGNKATDWSPAPEDVDAEINKRPTTDQIKAEFTIDPTGISMLGKKIALTGMVTFTALDASAQATINSKVTGNDIATKLGYSNYTDMINKATAGKTIINGGYINTNLVKADEIVTKILICRDSDGNIVSAVNREGDGAFRTYYANGQIQMEFRPTETNGVIASYSPTGLLNWKIGAGANFITNNIDSWDEVFLYPTTTTGSGVLNTTSLVGTKYLHYQAASGSPLSSYSGLTMKGTYSNNISPDKVTVQMMIINGWYTYAGPPHADMTEVGEQRKYARTLMRYANGYIVERKEVVFDA